MPGLGASPFGYKIAERLDAQVLPTRAGLVPFTLHKPLLEQLRTLSGVSVPCDYRPQWHGISGKTLFTHRGLSGPAVLQIFQLLATGQLMSINVPDLSLEDVLRSEQRNAHRTRV